MEREYQVSSQGSENVELKVAYFPRLHFLLIGEKVLAFTSDALDVFMAVIDTIIEEHVLHLIILRCNA
jgi:hypothetical protein